MSKRKFARAIGLGLAALSFSCGVAAQTGGWPNRPVKLVVPGSAGSGMDIYARTIAEPLSAALKQPFVVENKVGANSIIGIDAVAKAAPDGYTILLSPSSAIALNPLVHAKMPFDVQKDLAPVAQIGAGGTILVANPALGVKNLQELVRYVKANPGKLSYGTWGTGSSGHLVMEGIKAHFGLDIPHVPYKGTSQVVVDLLSGTILVGVTDVVSPLPHFKSGKLVALGMSGSARGPALPDVPTLTEQGYKFDADGWYGVFAPAGTPMPILKRLNEEIGKILNTQPMRDKFEAQNMQSPPFKSVEQFSAMVKSDIELWQSLAKAANLKAE